MKVVLGVLVLAAALLLGGPVAAAPTPEDLRAVILTRDEVGSGYVAYQDGPIAGAVEAGVPNYAVAYVRAPSFLNFAVSGVGVVLADAEAADTAGYAPEALLDQAAGFGLTVTPIDSPGIGEESQRYAVRGTVLGMAIQGEAITWKEYGVRAAVFAMSNVTNPSAMPYARRQSEKLAAAFGGG